MKVLYRPSCAPSTQFILPSMHCFQPITLFVPPTYGMARQYAWGAGTGAGAGAVSVPVLSAQSAAAALISLRHTTCEPCEPSEPASDGDSASTLSISDVIGEMENDNDDADDDADEAYSDCDKTRTAASSLASRRWCYRKASQPNPTAVFITRVREEWNPTGADFLDLVRILFENTKDQQARHPLRTKIAGMLRETGAGAKFVLRKLAASVLPCNGRSKPEFFRDVLRLPHVPTAEKDWTKESCLAILEAIVEHLPKHARIPLDLHTRSWGVSRV